MIRMLKSKLPTVESLLQPPVVDNLQQKLLQLISRRCIIIRMPKCCQVLRKVKQLESERERPWEPTIVTAQHTAGRSYIVKSPAFTAYRRNRRHLLTTVESPPVIVGPANDESATPSVVTPPA